MTDEYKVREVAFTPEEWAIAIVSSESFMWLMAGSNFVESNLSNLREAYAEYQAAGGRTWGRP